MKLLFLPVKNFFFLYHTLQMCIHSWVFWVWLSWPFVFLTYRPVWISVSLIYLLAVNGLKWDNSNRTRVFFTGFGWFRNDELSLNLLHPETARNGNLMGTGNKAVSLGNREAKSKPNQTRREVRISQRFWEKFFVISLPQKHHQAIMSGGGENPHSFSVETFADCFYFVV